MLVEHEKYLKFADKNSVGKQTKTSVFSFFLFFLSRMGGSVKMRCKALLEKVFFGYR